MSFNMHGERRWYNRETPKCNARKTLIACKEDIIITTHFKIVVHSLSTCDCLSNLEYTVTLVCFVCRHYGKLCMLFSCFLKYALVNTFLFFKTWEFLTI